jgi:hypothetical protein
MLLKRVREVIEVKIETNSKFSKLDEIKKIDLRN